jgi:hypothetical protein
MGPDDVRFLSADAHHKAQEMGEKGDQLQARVDNLD